MMYSYISNQLLYAETIFGGAKCAESELVEYFQKLI